MGALGGSREPIILFGRHQHELAPAVPRDLHRLTLRLMLEFTELALEFQGSGLDHNGQPLVEYADYTYNTYNEVWSKSMCIAPVIRKTSLVPDAPRPAPARRYREHDEA